MKDGLNAEILVRTRASPSEIYPEAESGSAWFEVYKFLRPSLKKISLQKYEYKIRYKNEYFCRMREEITKNYNYKEVSKYKHITKSRKIA
jgi:hypothetical protein